jgi:hypothetical protein
MSNPRYRLTSQLDYYNQYQCLNCKNNFICENDPLYEGWQLCPFCKIVWTEIFSKKNQRYTIPKLYREEYPKLKVEAGNIVEYELHPHSFAAKAVSKPKIHYALHTHTDFNPRYWPSNDTNMKSISVTLFNSYKEACAATYYNHVRLLYMRSEDDFDIIKEHHKDGLYKDSL